MEDIGDRIELSDLKHDATGVACGGRNDRRGGQRKVDCSLMGELYAAD